MSEKPNKLPSEKDELNEIFDALIEIGEVVENAQPLKEIRSITCPHCGKILSVENSCLGDRKLGETLQG